MFLQKYRWENNHKNILNIYFEILYCIGVYYTDVYLLISIHFLHGLTTFFAEITHDLRYTYTS